MDINQFLHAGAVVRNSEKVLALIIHTGKDCKINQNMDKYTTKYSSLDKNVQFVFMMLLGFMFLLILVASLVNKAFINRHREAYAYLFENSAPASEQAALGGLTMFLILVPIIPLQLIIIVDISKVFMARTMERDAWLMHP
jgi:phospholipid-translocating ATPase